MANLNIPINSKKVGISKNNVMFNPNGSAIYADQIAWATGDNKSKFNSYFFSTTSELLNAIEDSIADGVSQEAIGKKISTYINDNGIIPAVTVGKATYNTTYTTTVLSGIAIDDTNKHTIKPIYSYVQHPTAADMWDTTSFS